MQKERREEDVSEDDIDGLRALAREFGSHVTVAPNLAIAFRQRGPERVDGDV
ncbi:MAG: hypothetical protein KY461_04580 [Actinobacteria bacterium]|nr:hypothetical protein [Actinomycetota bacterium]